MAVEAACREAQKGTEQAAAQRGTDREAQGSAGKHREGWWRMDDRWLVRASEWAAHDTAALCDGAATHLERLWCGGGEARAGCADAQRSIRGAGRAIEQATWRSRRVTRWSRARHAERGRGRRTWSARIRLWINRKKAERQMRRQVVVQRTSGGTTYPRVRLGAPPTMYCTVSCGGHEDHQHHTELPCARELFLVDIRFRIDH